MTVPEIHVTGRAEREVVPDRVVVAVSVRTVVLPSAADALSACAAARRRLLDSLRAGRPADADAIRDGRVVVQPEQVRVEEQEAGRTIERWDVVGHRGACLIEVEGAAADAAAIVALAGAQPDTSSVAPRFTVSPTLTRSVDRELQQRAARDGMERAAGIAKALGAALGGIISVAEPDLLRAPEGLMAMSMSADRMGAAGIQADLGELRPEPVTMEASIAVRVALTP